MLIKSNGRFYGQSAEADQIVEFNVESASLDKAYSSTALINFDAVLTKKRYVIDKLETGVVEKRITQYPKTIAIKKGRG